MSETRTMLLLLKGLVSDLPMEQRDKVDDARDRITAIVGESEEARLALAFVTAEMAVEEESNTAHKPR